MKMKKTIALLVSAALAVSCLGGLVACGGDDNGNGVVYSETFSGAVSEKEYDTTENAVKGFLNEELSAGNTQAVFVDYTKEEELDQNQIAELDLGEYAEGLISVEKGTVEYSETKQNVSEQRNASASDTAEPNTYTRTVYILGYTGMFRFFVPPVKEGETITASYFSSTFKAEDYVNCTMNATMKESRNGHTYSTESLAKATVNMLYEYDTTIASGSYEGQSYSSKGYHELYMSDTANGIYNVSRYTDEETGKWTNYRIEKAFDYDDDYHDEYYPKADTINDYFMQWFDMRFGRLDHTYFIKTATGYALDPEKFADYIEEYVVGDYNPYDEIDFSTVKLEYTINVSEGRMSDVTTLVQVDSNTYSRMTVKFSAFGSTKISTPTAVSALLAEVV